MFEEYFDAVTKYLTDRGIIFNESNYLYWGLKYTGRDFETDFEGLLCDSVMKDMCYHSERYNKGLSYFNFSNKSIFGGGKGVELESSMTFKHGYSMDCDKDKVFLINFDRLINESVFKFDDSNPASDEDILSFLNN